MSDFRHHYKTGDGADVFFSQGHTDTAVLAPSDTALIKVPAHRLAEFCRALYAAAGQPAPDLPQIWDPATVDALAKDLRYAFDGEIGGPAGGHRAEALTLLSLGWRKP